MGIPRTAVFSFWPVTDVCNGLHQLQREAVSMRAESYPVLWGQGHRFTQCHLSRLASIAKAPLSCLLCSLTFLPLLKPWFPYNANAMMSGHPAHRFSSDIVIPRKGFVEVRNRGGGIASFAHSGGWMGDTLESLKSYLMQSYVKENYTGNEEAIRVCYIPLFTNPWILY